MPRTNNVTSNLNGDSPIRGVFWIWIKNYQKILQLHIIDRQPQWLQHWLVRWSCSVQPTKFGSLRRTFRPYSMNGYHQSLPPRTICRWKRQRRNRDALCWWVSTLSTSHLHGCRFPLMPDSSRSRSRRLRTPNFWTLLPRLDIDLQKNCLNALLGKMYNLHNFCVKLQLTRVEGRNCAPFLRVWIESVALFQPHLPIPASDAVNQPIQLSDAHVAPGNGHGGNFCPFPNVFHIEHFHGIQLSAAVASPNCVHFPIDNGNLKASSTFTHLRQRFPHICLGNVLFHWTKAFDTIVSTYQLINPSNFIS